MKLQPVNPGGYAGDDPNAARGSHQARELGRAGWLCRLPAAVVFCAWASCTPYGGQVTRVVDGQTQEGRYIPQPAYADYSLAAYLEASGEPEQAESAYVRALADDPQSPEMWTRLGALRCRKAPESGFPALERALSLAPNYEPTWRAKARCLLAAGKLSDASSAAQRAFQLDPNQEQVTLLMAEIFEQRRHPEQARLWLNAWVTRYPGATAAWQALAALARSSGNAGDLARAETALSHHALPRRAPADHPRPQPSVHRGTTRSTKPQPRDAIDTALDDNDLAAAQRASVALGLPAIDVALRAYLRGNEGIARAQASLLLEADPSNSDARVILLLLGDPAAAEALWATPDPLSPKVSALLAPALTGASR